MLGCGRSAAPAASGRRTTRVASRCGLCLLCVDSVCVRWCMARYASRRIATVGSRTRATRRMSTSQSARCVAARFRSIYVTVTQVTLTHVAASPASRHPGVGARPAARGPVGVVRARGVSPGRPGRAMRECADESPRPGCTIDPKYTYACTRHTSVTSRDTPIDPADASTQCHQPAGMKTPCPARNTTRFHTGSGSHALGSYDSKCGYPTRCRSPHLAFTSGGASEHRTLARAPAACNRAGARPERTRPAAAQRPRHAPRTRGCRAPPPPRSG